MKKIIPSTLLMLLAVVSFAQQSPQYSQYLFNGMIINPAYAGSKEVVNINGLGRWQWAGLDGAPNTQTISVDAPVYYKKIGLGVQFTNDNIGPQRSTSALLNFAYRIKVTTTGRLAVGFAAGATQTSIQGSKLSPDQANDPSVPTTTTKQWRPDGKVGIYFNSYRFYAGFSISEIFSFINSNDILGLRQQRHYYLTSGFLLNLGDRFKLKPNVLIKDDFNGPTNIDLNMFLMYNNFIWFGTSYRKAQRIFKNALLDNQNLRARDALAFIVEIYPTEKLRIGYAYDYTLTGLRNYNTHEISIGYYLFKSTDTKMLTPRYF